MVPSRLYKHLRPLAHTHFPIPTKWIHQWGIYPKPGRVLFSPSSDPANMGGGDRRREKKSWHLPANTSLKNTRCMLRYPTKKYSPKNNKDVFRKIMVGDDGGRRRREREREREKLLRNQYKTFISLFFFFFLLTIPLPFPVAASYSYSNFRTSLDFPTFSPPPQSSRPNRKKKRKNSAHSTDGCKYGKRFFFHFLHFNCPRFPVSHKKRNLL